MRQRRLLFLAGVVFFGPNLSTEAQQSTLPANPTNQLQPIIQAPGDANVPTPGSTVVNNTNTLPFTTVQSNRPGYNPGQKVTADKYFDVQGTTGSFRVNTDRAKDFQEAALQRALRKKRLQEQITSLPPQRMTYQSKLSPPVDELEPTPSSAPLSPGATYPGAGNNTAPPEPEIEYVKMRGRGGSLAGRIQAQKSRKAASMPPPPPPAEPSVTATRIVDTPPPEPAYPADSVSTFAPPELFDTAAAAALVSPPEPEKKSLFSRFGRKKSPSPRPEIPSVTAYPQVPPPSFQPSVPKPTFTSIFRPNASAKKANSFFVVQGEEVFAIVEGKQVKLTSGTRVRVLREGTNRSLVVLYDNRQATIANDVLTPETQ